MSITAHSIDKAKGSQNCYNKLRIFTTRVGYLVYDFTHLRFNTLEKRNIHLISPTIFLLDILRERKTKVVGMNFKKAVHANYIQLKRTEITKGFVMTTEYNEIQFDNTFMLRD